LWFATSCLKSLKTRSFSFKAIKTFFTCSLSVSSSKTLCYSSPVSRGRSSYALEALLGLSYVLGRDFFGDVWFFFIHK
jgi:hypothetical protein